MSRPTPIVLALAALFASGLSIAGGHGAAAQRARVIAAGADDYAQFCADCHGAEGRGDGRLASNLAMPPTDLTLIAAREGGEFPFWRVYDVIAGTVDVPGHDTVQMPRFAERMKADTGKPGYEPPYIRILLLTHYVESLQGE